MYHPFSVAETLKSSWDILRKNFATIIVYSVLSLLVMGAFGFLIYLFRDDSIIGIAGVFVLLIIISYNFLAFNKLIFKLMDNAYHEIGLRDIVPTVKMVASYLALLLTMSALTVFLSKGIEKLDEGLTQYILGILVGYMSQFFVLFYFPLCTCFIVDDQSGPFESVVQSFSLIKGNIIKYFVLFIVVEALILLASFTVVGFVLVIPIVNIILAATYRKLIYSHQDIDDDIAETN
jgi:nitrate reductase NapE component